MDKNILAFVNDKYKSFLLSDLIFRILGFFIYNYLLVFLVQILSPLGYNGVNYFSNNVFPYIIVLTINSTVFSISVIYICGKINQA